jgi:hypothetical protein
MEYFIFLTGFIGSLLSAISIKQDGVYSLDLVSLTLLAINIVLVMLQKL